MKLRITTFNGKNMFNLYVFLDQPFTWLDFFFSSRRRHTRSTRDWGSDVCSSDLEEVRRAVRAVLSRATPEERDDPEWLRAEIGRASCRERVEISVGVVSLKKKRVSFVSTTKCLHRPFWQLRGPIECHHSRNFGLVIPRPPTQRGADSAAEGGPWIAHTPNQKHPHAATTSTSSNWTTPWDTVATPGIPTSTSARVP